MDAEAVTALMALAVIVVLVAAYAKLSSQLDDLKMDVTVIDGVLRGFQDETENKLSKIDATTQHTSSRVQDLRAEIDA